MPMVKGESKLEEQQYIEQFELERSYWWFIGRRRIVAALLDAAAISKADERLVVDVGCGTGGNLELLSSYGTCVGMDISQFALSLCREHWNGLLVCADALRLPLRDCAAKLVAALDVLEHIEDDVNALREFWRVLIGGGVLVLTVPAFKWLWSGHDIALRHFRRYARAEIERKLVAVGFEIEKLSFAICPLLPFVFLFRKLQLIAQIGARKHTAFIRLPRLLNELLIGMLGLEARLIKHIELPFGISLICRAVKPSR